METNKRVIIFISSLVFWASSLSFFYSHNIDQAEKDNIFKSIPLSSDIQEVYDSFTDPTKELVESKLGTIACNPEQYYGQNSHICFVCESVHPCFGYVWVDRGMGERRDFSGSIYLAVQAPKISAEVVKFCHDRVASLLDCGENDKGGVECQRAVFFYLHRLNRET